MLHPCVHPPRPPELHIKQPFRCLNHHRHNLNKLHLFYHQKESQSTSDIIMGEFQGREPCPARICDDIGGAFAMGAVGGGIWHSVKGFRNAPKGLNNRFFYSIDAVKARAPVTGGSFATWGALFAAFDCTFAAVRHKEDPWNSIMSGAATGGVLAMRGAFVNELAGKLPPFSCDQIYLI